MENDYFFSTGIPPQHQQFQTSLAELQMTNSSQISNSQKTTEQNSQVESSLSSMVSSPVTNNSTNDTYAIRELIGKLGTICNSGHISPQFSRGNTYISIVNNIPNTSSSSSYNTTRESPSNLQVPIMHHFVKENLPISRNSMYMSPVLPALPTDPGFAERAAKFSCFGSKSFNGRTSQTGIHNAEFQYRSSGLSLGNSKLHRVASSPSLQVLGSHMGIQENKNESQLLMDMRPNNFNASDLNKKISNSSCSGANSNEESSVSAQNAGRENVSSTLMGLNSRKRKGFPKGKGKEVVSTECTNFAKEAGVDDITVNRSKMKNCIANKNDGADPEEVKGDSADEQMNNNEKPLEPLKDYIHVRARRGQATDSHSLAERVRREKISKRMKTLEDLVPGCNKVTGKALMLDEIINYVQSLQQQVEFLSMKLATVNPRLDINMGSLLSKKTIQPNGTIPRQSYPVDSSLSAYYGHHQSQQIPQVRKTLESIDAAFCRNLGMQIDGHAEGLSQFPSLSEDDLQSIVQMGLATNQIPHMKLEL